MTIVQKIDSRKIKAQKAYVNAYYEGNVFLADNPEAFFQIWQLLEEHNADWQKELQTNLLYYKAKKWLDNLFVRENPKIEITLTVEDIVKLVMNNVTKLPNCKCRLRKLNVK